MSVVVDADAGSVLCLLRRFLCHHQYWSSIESPEQLSITRIDSGFINRNFIIRKVSAAIGTDTDDQKKHQQQQEQQLPALLLKLYGGNVATDDPEITLSTECEILLCHNWSLIGQGPKLLSVFPGGRLEEFIPSHTLTPAEVSDPQIRRSLARTIADFHCMDLPLPRPAFDFPTLLRKMLANFLKDGKKNVCDNAVFAEKKIDISEAASYDYGSDIDWLSRLLTPEHQRLVLTHGDLHGHNILIRNPDNQVILIDLQESGYNWRGRDWGLFLLSSSLDMGNVDASDALGFPADEVSFPFFDEYMTRVRELQMLPDMDRTSKDSNEHLVFESMTGGLVSVMYVLLLIMSRHQVMVTGNPVLAVCLIALFNSYMACRRQLRHRFPDSTAS